MIQEVKAVWAHRCDGPPRHHDGILRADAGRLGWVLLLEEAKTEGLIELAEGGRHLVKPRIHLCENAACVEFSGGAAFARAHAT